MNYITMKDSLEWKFYKQKRNLLYVVSGPSGAGKTTLCKELAGVSINLAHSSSHTTRKPRKGEIEGIHYYFVNEKEFRNIAKSDGFIEWATVHDNLYGTSKFELNRLFSQGKDVIIDVDTKGAAQVKESGLGDVFIFILPPSLKELERRLKGRDLEAGAPLATFEKNKRDINLRLFNAVEEIKQCDKYDYIVENDNLMDSLDLFKSIVIAERSKVKYIDTDCIKKQFAI